MKQPGTSGTFTPSPGVPDHRQVRGEALKVLEQMDLSSLPSSRLIQRQNP